MRLMRWENKSLTYILLCLYVILCSVHQLAVADTHASAKPKLAVLAFELHDLTLLPATPAELARTQSAQHTLASALQAAGYPLTPVDSQLQNQANQGVGYLLDHPEKTAELGQAIHADYVLVGRVHKPSFLFAYLMVQLVDVKTAKRLADFTVEAKGENIEATKRALLQIAAQIDETLSTPTKQTTAVSLFTAPIYQKTTTKAFQLVIDDLLFAISQHNFRLTEQSNIGQAIAEREEKPFPKITVLHMCNLSYAQTLLEKQLASPLHLPCRISVREDRNQVVIETLLLPNNPAQQALVDEINQILQTIVNTGAD